MKYDISLVFPYLPLISLRKFPSVLLDFVVLGLYSIAMVYYIDFQMLVFTSEEWFTILFVFCGLCLLVFH